MINNVTLVGRVTHDPELQRTKDGSNWCRFSLALNHAEEVDFVNVVVFNETAENLVKYMKKGSKLGVVGRIKTGKYEHKDGYTVYTFDIVGNKLTYLDSKDDAKQAKGQPQQQTADNVPF